jgi:hypothetical protein
LFDHRHAFDAHPSPPTTRRSPRYPGHATASRPDPTKKRDPIKKSGLLQQPHTELAYASRLAAAPSRSSALRLFGSGIPST